MSYPHINKKKKEPKKKNYNNNNYNYLICCPKEGVHHIIQSGPPDKGFDYNSDMIRVLQLKFGKIENE